MASYLLKAEREVGEVEYRTWLTKIALGPIDGDEITLLCLPASCAIGCAVNMATA